MLDLPGSCNIACQTATCTTAPPVLASLQVGSWEYLFNHRKGLRAQEEKSRLKAELAGREGLHDEAQEARLRLRWVRYKIHQLNDGIMIWDMPGVWEGESRPYGLLNAETQRNLSPTEWGWNSRMQGWERRNPPGPTGITDGVRREFEERQRERARHLAQTNRGARERCCQSRRVEGAGASRQQQLVRAPPTAARRKMRCRSEFPGAVGLGCWKWNVLRSTARRPTLRRGGR